MKNSSQTQHCRSKTRGKNSKKQKKWSITGMLFLRALCIMPATVHPAARSCFLRCALFAFVFGFFPIYPCNSLPILVFFCNFPYTKHLYKPQCVQTQINQFGNREPGAAVSLQLPFLHFLSFSLPFSAAKHSSEDENSEDGWLDLFPLEEEGYWATVFKVNFWFPCFSRSRF